jgi:hypothetical protein
MSDTQGRADVAATPDSAAAYTYDPAYDPAYEAYRTSARGRSPGAIEADIAWTREHLAHTLDEIAVRVDPRHVARRGADRVRMKTDQARSYVVDAEGRPRSGRLALACGTVTAAVVAVVLARRQRR